MCAGGRGGKRVEREKRWREGGSLTPRCSHTTGKIMWLSGYETKKGEGGREEQEEKLAHIKRN